MRLRLGVVVLVGLTACGGGDSTGPGDYPALAGTYAGTVTISFSNSIEQDSESSPITVTLQNANKSGNFTGSYVIPNGGGSGPLAGTVRSDGGISITQFGDASADPGQSVTLLQNVFYWCNFNQAGASPFTGGLSGSTVSFGGAIILPCSYINPTRTVTSTIGFQITGNRS